MDNLENKVTLDSLLTVSSAPHVRSKENVSRIMLDVLIALAPTTIASFFIFGYRAALLVAASILTAVASEFIFEKATERNITIGDYSAVITGLLLALNVPVSMPIWKVMFGSMFAIIVVKQFFGGLGQNFMNPALAARAVLMTSFAKDMSNFTKPFTDMVSTATPLAGGEMPTLMDAFIGKMPGTLGEVSKICLLIGAAYLVYRKVISLRIPLIYIASTAVFLFAFGVSLNDVLMQVLTGGLILGAFFMATDYATVPVNPKGQIVFALGCGLLTALIRQFGGYPEGVSYSIIIMNIFVPLIEKFTKTKTFGSGRK